MRRNRPDTCQGCDRPVRYRAELADTPGAVLYKAVGLCNPCHLKKCRERIQPPGQPKARRVPREVLLDEVPFLRGNGYEDEQIAERLGMRPLSFRRALGRAGLSRAAA